MDEARTQMQVMGNLFNKNKTNKQKLPRRGKTNLLASRQGRAGQGWTGHRRHLT